MCPPVQTRCQNVLSRDCLQTIQHLSERWVSDIVRILNLETYGRDLTLVHIALSGSSFIIFYYDQQMHNYFTNYHTPTCFGNIVSSSALVINTVPSYTSMTNAGVGNTVKYNIIQIVLITGALRMIRYCRNM
jgi:hypothetical protein